QELSRRRPVLFPPAGLTIKGTVKAGHPVKGILRPMLREQEYGILPYGVKPCSRRASYTGREEERWLARKTEVQGPRRRQDDRPAVERDSQGSGAHPGRARGQSRDDPSPLVGLRERQATAARRPDRRLRQNAARLV